MANIMATGTGAMQSTVGRRHVGDNIHSALYARLMLFRIKPGHRLQVDQIAREFGVSQTPVREALARLEGVGLVVRSQHTGYSAAPLLDASQLRELFDLRHMLEPPATAAAAIAMSDDGVQRLADILNLMRIALRGEMQDSSLELVSGEGEFHALIAGACGNRLVQGVLAGLNANVHLFRVALARGSNIGAIEELSAIADAISRRDAKAASAAAKRYLQLHRRRFDA